MKNLIIKLFFILCLIPAAYAQDTAPAAENKGIMPVQTPAEAEFSRPLVISYLLPSGGAAVLEDQESFSIIKSTADKNNPNLINVEAVPFNLGASTLTAITFQLNNGQELKSEPLLIDIKPTKTKVKETGLIDIRSPYRPFNWFGLFLFILGALLGIAAVIYFVGRKAKPVQLPVGPYGGDPRPIHVIALEQIDNLEQSGLWEKGEYKLFYIKLIDIFRDYLSVRFDIDAYQYTSRELERKLFKKFSGEQFDFLFTSKNDPTPKPPDFKAILPKIKELNASADLVKFARQTPTETIRNRDIDIIKDIILFTKQGEDFVSIPTNQHGAGEADNLRMVDIKKAIGQDKNKGGGLP